METTAMATQAPKLNQKLNYSMVGKENDMMMIGGLISKKSGIDLMQNCDLPPPLKVFAGLDKAVELMSFNNRAGYSIMGQEDDKNDDGKLEIIKALRLSQTRAREAERKAADLAEEKQRVSDAFMRESLQLFAYRQWVRLLEIQVWVLKSQMVEKDKNFCDKTERQRVVEEGTEGGNNNGDEMSLIVALAICLGIASVGLAFGCRYLF
ncbi:hypothetical protein J1N35_007096 [Gossypium stocksii]|uniref:Uncharacterized protein n=1 Tax=Gossypium stocksii TaxID=47602 RepID=A0A9D3W7V4_9ROSI|nr:hypothetical protein J1N35_007096 [Gossypium stocksii]